MDTTDSLTAPMPIRRYPGRIAVLLGLVALADFLIFGQEPGINLFLLPLPSAPAFCCRPRRSCRLRRRLSSWACRSWLRRLCSKHRQQWALPFASQP